MPIQRVALIYDNEPRPETTGTYCLRALREFVYVEHFRPHELDRISRTAFDLYLNIDDGLRYRLPSDLRPCAWWVIDTHLDAAWALDKGQDFDWRFAAQRDGAALLNEAGLAAQWLPLAHDPGIHRPHAVGKRWDVGFVGRISAGVRQDLLWLVQRQFANSFAGQAHFEDMARIYSQSRIVFNRSVRNDVNMRVFEALGCGSLLITNDLADNGQEELLTSGTHCITYEGSEDLLEKLQFYLAHDEIREQIAQAGHAEVIARHTYRHRMESLLQAVEAGDARCTAPEFKREAQPIATKTENETTNPAGSESQTANENKNPARQAGSTWLDSIDFVVKTFLRPQALLRLLRSIAKFYPQAHVTIADDGDLRDASDADSRACCELIDANDRIVLHSLPFDSGVTPGRNLLVDKTGRPYLLLLDDDFCCTSETDIRRLLDRLQSEPELGVAAGACIDVFDDRREHRSSGGTLQIDGQTLVIDAAAWRDRERGLRDYVPHFALFRREVFGDVRWEGDLGAEHYDFCLQLQRSRWKVVQDTTVSIDHHHFSDTLPGYAERRFDCAEARQWLLHKWNLERVVQGGQTIIERDASCDPPSSILHPPPSLRPLPEKDAAYFEFPRPEVAALVPATARRVLDIGCGAGALGALLKDRQPAEVVGIEMQPAAAAIARQRLDQVIEQNVEDPGLDFESGRFDCIICADVLEHLREPARLLAQIRRWLAPDGVLIASLPNVRHHSVVSSLLEGNWTYESAGLLDSDHVRFFTRREIEKLLYRQGFEIQVLHSKPGPGYDEWHTAGRPGEVHAGSLHITGLSSNDAEEFFTYQYLVVAHPTFPPLGRGGQGEAHPANRAGERDSCKLEPSVGSSQLSVANSQIPVAVGCVKPLSGDDAPASDIDANRSAALAALAREFPWPAEKPAIPLPTDKLGWFKAPQQELIRRELNGDTKLVVELGAWLGLSTRFMADQAPNATIVTIDHWQGSPEHHADPTCRAMLPTLFESFGALNWEYRHRILPLRMSGHDGLRTIARHGLMPDVIFIDADHRYEAVSADLQLSHELFPKARLIGDDYDSPDVQRAVDEFAAAQGYEVEPVGDGWRAWRLVFSPSSILHPPSSITSRSAQHQATSVPRSPVACNPLTSLIILTHNQLAFTKECIDSIRMRTDEPYELIFVDNGSTDGTVEYLRNLSAALSREAQPSAITELAVVHGWVSVEQYALRGVQLIENAANRGFPAAVNQGLAIARGEFVVLLNNDTVVTTGWLRRLRNVLERDPKIGLAGPCSNYVSGAQMVPARYGNMTSLDGFAWEWAKRHAGVIEETERLVGFCLAMKRAVIDDIGLLDERFGIGCFEDDDLCLRARRAGWRAVIAREAFIHHYGNRTFEGSGIDLGEVLETNRQKFLEKWHNSPPLSKGGPAGVANAGSDDTNQNQNDKSEIPNPKSEICTSSGNGEQTHRRADALRSPSTVLLSLCMIVRDNEQTIGAALESIRPWVDEMVIVDTGSTDRTAAICREYGARVFDFPWCDDFSAARNESLKHARGEWIFWMDSDDTISPECGKKLRDLVNSIILPPVGTAPIYFSPLGRGPESLPPLGRGGQGGSDEPSAELRNPKSPLLNSQGRNPKCVLGFVMQVYCPGPGDSGRHDITIVDHVKLIRNRPDLRFEGRIHEQLLPAIRRAGGDVAWTDIHVVHSGSDHSPTGWQRKLDRDLRILHRELDDDPNHPFVLFNLGMTYADAASHSDLSDASRNGERNHGQEDGGWKMEDGDQSLDGGTPAFRRDLPSSPDVTSGLHPRPITRSRLDLFNKAIHYLQRCLAVSVPEESHARKAYALLVSTLSQADRYDDAWTACTNGLALYPDDKELLFRSAMLHHHFGGLRQAAETYLRVLHGREERHFSSVDGALAGFKARFNLAIVYEDMGRLAHAEAEWRQIVRDVPDYAPARRGLGENLIRQGKHADAANLMPA